MFNINTILTENGVDTRILASNSIYVDSTLDLFIVSIHHKSKEIKWVPLQKHCCISSVVKPVGKNM